MPRAKVTRAGFRSLPAALARRADGKRIVGFDVLDTLLRRRVEPESIKDLVARRLAERLSQHTRGTAVPRGRPLDWRLVRHKRCLLETELCQANVARGLDHEFDLREMTPRWIERCCGTGVPDGLAERMIRDEIELEQTATLPTPNIRQALACARRLGARLLFISDSYLPAEVLWRLLHRHGLADFFQSGYSSCDTLRTKHSGRLFQQVLETENIEPGDLLFVGDHAHSDVATPRRLGIDVIHVRDRHERARRTRLQLLEHLATRNRFWKGGLFCHVIESAPRHLKPDRSPDYCLGLMLAPAFIAFTLYVIEQARALGLRRLFFLSREGLTFMRMYRRIVRALGLRHEAPQAVYLGVSRIATFLPSLDRLDAQNLRRMWRQYDRQSLNRILRNLSLPHQEFQPLAKRCGLHDLELEIEEPDAHAGFRAFLMDADVQRRFRIHRDRARALLQEYLDDKGLFGIGAAGLVDIGWKGSIQDNILRAAGSRADVPVIHGLYFGLAEDSELEPPGSHKHAYLADARRDDWIEQVVFRNGPLFEMFSSAGHGGVTGYCRSGPGTGKVKPVVEPDPIERRNYRAYTASVLAGVEDYLREYLPIARLIPATSSELKPYVLDRLRRYILYPTLREARNFLRYSHVESFGVFHETTYEFKGSWRRILCGGSPLGAPRRLIQALERNLWPEGCLRRARIPLANLLFDLLETHYHSRAAPE